MGVSLAWAAATILLAYAGENVGAIGLWAIRTPVGAAGLLLFAVATRRPALGRLFADRTTLLVILGAGVIGTAVGSLCYVYSVVEIGAGRAAVLSATSPLMALPLALIFLKERINVRVAAGTAACVMGIVLVAGS
jgi:drug/metabolite transporter (DMT)-like permease